MLLPWGGRWVRIVVAGVALMILSTTATATAVPMLASSSSGDPSSNTAPDPSFVGDCSATYDDSQQCVDITLDAINHARAQEGVGAMVLPTDWYSLSVPEQFFVATNLERIGRGLPALTGMATALDSSAAQAAAQAKDPTPPSGFPMTSWDANWAGDGGNPLEIIYYFMYYDGPGGNNTGCSQAGQPGCWVHRDNILADFNCQPCVIGSGYSPTGYQGETSYAELLVDATGNPELDFSWSQVRPYLPNDEYGSDPSPASNVGAATNAPAQSASHNQYSSQAGGSHRMVGSDGGVFDFGSDGYYGSVPGLGMSVDDIVSMAPTPDNDGYWLVGRDARIFAFGDAKPLGSLGGHVLAAPIVGMASTPDGGGYWLVGSDGGVFSFGDAHYAGSVPNDGYHVNDIVAIVASPNGNGYYLVGRHGEVWSFGASWYGSPFSSGDSVGNIVGMESTPDGKGYWVVSSTGSIFNFGDAPYLGSLPGDGVHVGNVVGMAPTADGGGYWLFGSDGGDFAFGDAPYFASLPGQRVHVHDVVAGTGR